MKIPEISDPKQPDLFELLRSQTETEMDQQSAQQPTDEINQPTTEFEQFANELTDESQTGLPQEARRALVALLRYGVIMAANKRLLFDALCRYQTPIQAHLENMYLRMLLDEQAGLVLLLQEDGTDTDEEEETSSLISRRTMTLYDTLLVLVLRKHYQDRETAGEQRVIIDIDRIEIALRPFLPLTNSSRSDRRQLSSALKNMKERRILAALRSEEERFEITPVIRYVVNAEFLEKMLQEYLKLVEQASTDD